MGFVTSERVELFYTFLPAAASKGRLDDIETMDRDYPCIVAPSPWGMDVTYLKHLHTAAFDGYNRILIDMRGHGRSTVDRELCFEVDYFVCAADIAAVVNRLKIPPCHYLGVQGHGGNVLIAMAILHPSAILSLSFMSFTDPTGMANVTDSSVKELAASLQLINSPEDIYEIIGSITDVTLDPKESEILDDWVATFIRRYINNKSIRILFLIFINLSRPRKVDALLLSEITAPMYVCHGTKDVWFPLARVEKVINMYSSTTVELHVIENATHAHYLYPQYQEEIASTLLPFLKKHNPSKKTNQYKPLNFNYALQRVSWITSDPSVITRNSGCASSYSLLDEAERLNTKAGVEAVEAINLEIIPNLIKPDLEKWHQDFSPDKGKHWSWSSRHGRRNSYQELSYSRSATTVEDDDSKEMKELSREISSISIESIVWEDIDNELISL